MSLIIIPIYVDPNAPPPPPWVSAVLLIVLAWCAILMALMGYSVVFGPAPVVHSVIDAMMMWPFWLLEWIGVL